MSAVAHKLNQIHLAAQKMQQRHRNTQAKKQFYTRIFLLQPAILWRPLNTPSAALLLKCVELSVWESAAETWRKVVASMTQISARSLLPTKMQMDGKNGNGGGNEKDIIIQAHQSMNQRSRKDLTFCQVAKRKRQLRLLQTTLTKVGHLLEGCVTPKVNFALSRLFSCKIIICQSAGIWPWIYGSCLSTKAWWRHYLV